MNLRATDEDYAELWRDFPLAQERLKVIVLVRLLKEKEQEIATLKEGTLTSSEPVEES